MRMKAGMVSRSFCIMPHRYSGTPRVWAACIISCTKRSTAGLSAGVGFSRRETPQVYCTKSSRSTAKKSAPASMISPAINAAAGISIKQPTGRFPQNGKPFSFRLSLQRFIWSMRVRQASTSGIMGNSTCKAPSGASTAACIRAESWVSAVVSSSIRVCTPSIHWPQSSAAQSQVRTVMGLPPLFLMHVL